MARPHPLPEAASRFFVGWVLNLLKSGLLQEMFPSKQMNAYWEKTTASVRVPQTFDMPID